MYRNGVVVFSTILVSPRSEHVSACSSTTCTGFAKKSATQQLQQLKTHAIATTRLLIAASSLRILLLTNQSCKQ